MIFNYQYIEKNIDMTIVNKENTPVENSTIFKYLRFNIKHNKPSTRDSKLEMDIVTGHC